MPLAALALADIFSLYNKIRLHFISIYQSLFITTPYFRYPRGNSINVTVK